jgi:hypothetical protein
MVVSLCANALPLPALAPVAPKPEKPQKSAKP